MAAIRERSSLFKADCHQDRTTSGTITTTTGPGQSDPGEGGIPWFHDPFTVRQVIRMLSCLAIKKRLTLSSFGLMQDDEETPDGLRQP